MQYGSLSRKSSNKLEIISSTEIWQQQNRVNPRQYTFSKKNNDYSINEKVHVKHKKTIILVKAQIES